MTHIAHCIRESVLERGQVRSPAEISPFESKAREENKQCTRKPSQREAHAPPKYQLWPSTRSPGYHNRSFTAEKVAALSVPRSDTAMSDSILTSQRPGSSGRKECTRKESFSRRRKISIAEISSGPSLATLQEACMDSPTIPGRFPLQQPLQQPSFDARIEEKSSPSPGSVCTWRANPFGDAMVSCITGPAQVQMGRPAPLNLAMPPRKPLLRDTEPSLPPLRPLSPILSPGVDQRSSLMANFSPIDSPDDANPPAVPPKSPMMNSSKPSPTQRQPPRLNTKAPSASPAESLSSATPWSAQTDPFPLTKSRREYTVAHWRNDSCASIIDRGRPIRRGQEGDHSPTDSETSPTMQETAQEVVEEMQETTQESEDSWTLPVGIPATEASSRIPLGDIESLHDQAVDQASQFEVLTSHDVATLSRELRALDERCEYLRKTYKSLREGRSKLQQRMISYLSKGDTMRFSRENLLKHEEALVELDMSIDDWISKIEQAENRRLRIRQKLLEHVAAAVVISPLSPSPSDGGDATPPQSPLDEESVENELRSKRRDVESIRIYADGNILDLFSDIEQAVGAMCEAC